MSVSFADDGRRLLVTVEGRLAYKIPYNQEDAFSVELAHSFLVSHCCGESLAVAETLEPFCSECRQPQRFSLHNLREAELLLLPDNLTEGTLGSHLADWLMRTGVEPLLATLQAQELLARTAEALEIVDKESSLGATFKRVWAPEGNPRPTVQELLLPLDGALTSEVTP